MRWLNRFAYRYGKYAIKNIMSYIAGGMALVYILDYVFAMTGKLEYGTLQSLLYFNRELIFQGQVWRIITFLFIPSSSNVIFLIFAIMFYYMLGQGLEQEWGAPQLNLYLLIGYLCTLVGGFIMGYTTATYLYLSLFFAFAIYFPDFMIRIFYIIPVKIKYLAILDAVLFIWSLITSTWYVKIAILISIANLILFFYKQAWDRIKLEYVHIKSKIKYNRK